MHGSGIKDNLVIPHKNHKTQSSLVKHMQAATTHLIHNEVKLNLGNSERWLMIKEPNIMCVGYLLILSKGLKWLLTNRKYKFPKLFWRVFTFTNSLARIQTLSFNGLTITHLNFLKPCFLHLIAVFSGNEVCWHSKIIYDICAHINVTGMSGESLPTKYVLSIRPSSYQLYLKKYMGLWSYVVQ